MNIHYFQRYSQKENVVTNNTLLLLSRLHNSSPIKFQAFLYELLRDTQIDVGCQFIQQTQSGNSIPDGIISQSSFKVVIETKLHESFSITQLENHLASFDNEEFQFLLSLSPRELDDNKVEEIENRIKSSGQSVNFVSSSFATIIEKMKSILHEADFELEALIDDYADFISGEGLIPLDEYRMRAVTCGLTIRENFNFNVYYDPAERGYRPHSYLGIYHQKSIRGIGKIANIVTAELHSNDKLEILSTTNGTVSENLRENIIGAIHAARENRNWDISKGHKFFCVEQFHKLNFIKSTKYPLQGTKYFYFNNHFKEGMPPTAELAGFLDGKTWEFIG